MFRRERERVCVIICLKLPKKSFFLQNEGSKGIYSEKVTLQLSMPLVGLPTTLLRDIERGWTA